MLAPSQRGFKSRSAAITAVSRRRLYTFRGASAGLSCHTVRKPKPPHEASPLTHTRHQYDDERPRHESEATPAPALRAPEAAGREPFIFISQSARCFRLARCHITTSMLPLSFSRIITPHGRRQPICARIFKMATMTSYTIARAHIPRTRRVRAERQRA